MEPGVTSFPTVYTVPSWHHRNPWLSSWMDAAPGPGPILVSFARQTGQSIDGFAVVCDLHKLRMLNIENTYWNRASFIARIVSDVHGFVFTRWSFFQVGDRLNQNDLFSNATLPRTLYMRGRRFVLFCPCFCNVFRRGVERKVMDRVEKRVGCAKHDLSKDRKKRKSHRNHQQWQRHPVANPVDATQATIDRFSHSRRRSNRSVSMKNLPKSWGSLQ